MQQSSEDTIARVVATNAVGMTPHRATCTWCTHDRMTKLSISTPNVSSQSRAQRSYDDVCAGSQGAAVVDVAESMLNVREILCKLPAG